MTTPDVLDGAEIERIVAGLSEAMRNAILRAQPSFSGKLDRVNATGVTRKALRERGLGHGDWCYLTPLGQQVKAHLARTVHPLVDEARGQNLDTGE